MSDLATSDPMVNLPVPQGSGSSSPALQTGRTADSFLEVPSPPQPLSPPLLSCLPSSADDLHLVPTTPVQLVRRGTSSSSPPPLSEDIHSRFLLYNSAGRLVGAREPTDPWGVLVSEHITLNCTYNHRTVRVGREDDCDAVLKSALVSTTHFTISLELEPYEPQDDSSGSSPTESAGVAESVGDSVSKLRWKRRTLRSADAVAESTTNACHVTEDSAKNPPEQGMPSSSTTAPLSPQDVGLPGWRVRRVLLTDCSANGTYMNDELVGRGHYRELHSGSDINIVRMPEATCQGGAAPSPFVSPYAATRSSSSSSDTEGVQGNELNKSKMDQPRSKDEGSKKGKNLIQLSRRALRELKRKHPTAPSVTPAVATAATTTTTNQRRRRAREGDHGGGGGRDDDEDGSGSDSALKQGDLEKTQTFTALLSTLSTEYTYLERFCFHLYNTEEQPHPQPHGMGAASDVPLDPHSYTAPVMQRNYSEVHVEMEEEEWKAQKELRGSTQRDPAVLPKPLPPRSLQKDNAATASAVDVATVPHQRSVHFLDEPEAEVDTKQAEEDSKGLATSTNSGQSKSSTTTAAAALSSAPLSSRHSGELTASTGPPCKLTARQDQVVSTLVTPFSLLRPRPSIRTSFIAPIVLSERESSTGPSLGSPPHHLASAPSSSTAATRFHESLSISHALQRKAAAQQRAGIRRVHDSQILASGNSSSRANVGGASGGLLKDVPADIPIRYAVLPLRHLQWGGRIGCGASGEVYMGIDVSTATAVAIKVLKGGSLFPSAEEGKALPVVTEGQGGDGDGAILSTGQSPAIRPDEDTLLSLSDVSMGNSLPTSRSSSRGSVSVSTSPATSTSASTPCAASKAATCRGKCFTDKDDEQAPPGETRKRRAAAAIPEVQLARTMAQRENEEAYTNEESAPQSAVTTPFSPASSSSANTPREYGQHTSTAAITSMGSGKSALALTSTQPKQQQRQQRRGPQATRPSAPPIIRKHFREIVFLTTLQHQRIVRFLGFQFNVDGRLCLLLEYVAGGTLQTLIRNFGAFEENVIRLYTLQILEGLEYLARKGVVHGDLKSANILVSEQGSVKLADFGTSRFVRECATSEVSAEGATSTAGRRSRASSSRNSSASQQQSQRHSTSHRADGSFLHNAERDVNDTSQSCSMLRHLGNEEERGRERRSCPRSRSIEEEEGEGEEGDSAFSEECSDDQSEEPGDYDDDGVSQQRVLCGTPLYMSPELIRTQEPSFASDIWALGCVVYEMATGGVLPWRPVHHSNASAVIWYIGQRRSASEGPSLDDVYAERERLNQAAMSRSEGTAEFFDMEDSKSEGDEEGNQQQPGGALNATPSPMLIDLLQCTLNVSAADRPSAAELLQHPFIRGESSLAALEKWHATVSAKHRAIAAKSASKQIQGGATDPTEEGKNGNNSSSSNGDGDDYERKRPCSSTRSSTGSPFETAIFTSGGGSSTIVNNSGNGNGNGSAKAVMPSRTSPPPFLVQVPPQLQQPLVEEVVDVDGDDAFNKDGDDRSHSQHAFAYPGNEGEGSTGRSTSAAASLPPPLSTLPQPAPSILVKTSAAPHPGGSDGDTRSSSGNKKSLPASLPLGDSWEDVKPLSISSDAPTHSPPLAADATASHPENETAQASPALIAQPHPQLRVHQSNRASSNNHRNSEAPSVLGEGNPDSQPLISEPPHPNDVTVKRTSFWGQAGRRDSTLPTGTPESTQMSPLLFSSTVSPSPHLSHASYHGSNMPAQAMSQSFSGTAPNFKVPLPRSQTQGLSCVSQQQRYVQPASQPCGNFPRSMIAEHQMFLREKEQERRSSSLAPLQPTRQVRGRLRTEAALPTYNAATYQQQGSVLGNSRGYRYQNPQLTTQTMEMHVPLHFSSQSPPSAAGRYGHQQQQQQHGKSHGSKRKARMGSAMASQNQASQNNQQQSFNAQWHKPRNAHHAKNISQDYANGGGGVGAPIVVEEGTHLSMSDVPAARSPRGPGPRSRPVLEGVPDSNGGNIPQRAHYPPSQMCSSWKPSELTLEMDKMALSSPRAGGTMSAPVSAYAGAAPQSSRFAMHSNNNSVNSGMMLMSSQQTHQQQQRAQQMQGPASPLDYAVEDTTPVLGEGSRPQRRFLLRRGRGGRRCDQERRQRTAAAQVHNGEAEEPRPRRSSIGSLRQRRRRHGRQANHSSGISQQMNSENKSAVLPSPPPASAQVLPQAEQPKPQAVHAGEQHKAAQKETLNKSSAASPNRKKPSVMAGKRSRVAQSRSFLRGKSAAKRELRRGSKKSR
ncbi:putative protein kinase [Leptomonas seymouri]|uniref:Protein kinase domain-containing protein n=1 Tax=Leptomonas seymouri TaxID=5684 RepID=A0A0N1IJS9_LEPSE|nr:putative protein kinase [Leptomonas seymouri]|eukprot:KPI85442.1 putative protein kinase [Leptomonas seymouri]